MSTSLPDRFDDLAADIDPADVSADLGPEAWAAGRRRQRRSRVLTIGVAVVVVLLAALTVLPVVGAGLPVGPASSDGDADAVSGYPERIGHQWHVGGLPSGEPMAALLQRDENGDIGWYAVSASGRQYQLPGGGAPGGVFPTLSPDGRYVGYLAPDGRSYLLRDLVSDTTIAFPDIGTPEAGTRYAAVADAPAFWSPDGTRLLLAADPRDGGRTSALLLGLDRTVTPVVGDPTNLAGATDAGEVVRVYSPSAKQLSVTFDQPDGTVAHTIDLTVDLALSRTLGDGWHASISPDATRLALADDLEEVAAIVHLFSLEGSSGDEFAPVPVPAVSGSCPIAWVANTPVMTVRDGSDGATSTLLAESPLRDPITVVESSSDTRCLMWAGSALEAGPQHALWGTSTGWFTWWWRELTAALLVLLALGWLVVRTHRRDAPGGPTRLDLLSRWRPTP